MEKQPRWRGAALLVAVVIGSQIVLAISPATAGNFLTVSRAHKLFYTKKQSNRRYARKSSVYTKAQSDARYPQKADVYTKTESDAQFLQGVWATVASNGGLIRGRGTTTGGGRSTTGTYVVAFNRDVASCAKAVTPYTNSPVYATVLDDSSNTKADVFTFDKNGALADSAFHLSVIC
jgi:hypothetical protein